MNSTKLRWRFFSPSFLVNRLRWTKHFNFRNIILFGVGITLSSARSRSPPTASSPLRRPAGPGRLQGTCGRRTPAERKMSFPTLETILIFKTVPNLFYQREAESVLRGCEADVAQERANSSHALVLRVQTAKKINSNLKILRNYVYLCNLYIPNCLFQNVFV